MNTPTVPKKIKIIPLDDKIDLSRVLYIRRRDNPTVEYLVLAATCAGLISCQGGRYFFNTFEGLLEDYEQSSNQTNWFPCYKLQPKKHQ